MKHLLTILFSLAVPLTAAERYDPLKPYNGPSARGVDASTLTGKVMTGYQGWFNCEGDGAGLGWNHWAKNKQASLGPDSVKVDLWPDVSEYAKEELYATDFKLTDGSSVKVFSSYNRATVLRHFEWMREYGIDGAFVQRFANGLRNEKIRHNRDTVLAHAREGANLSGRAYAAMFDEVDEGTAIFKCTNHLPVGPAKFVDYEGLPSDHYLWLTGHGAALLRGEISLQASPPKRTP